MVYIINHSAMSWLLLHGIFSLILQLIHKLSEMPECSHIISPSFGTYIPSTCLLTCSFILHCTEDDSLCSHWSIRGTTQVTIYHYTQQICRKQSSSHDIYLLKIEPRFMLMFHSKKLHIFLPIPIWKTWHQSQLCDLVSLQFLWIFKISDFIGMFRVPPKPTYGTGVTTSLSI